MSLPTVRKHAQENFSDQDWRLNNLYWVKGKEGGKLKYRMTDYTRELYDEMHFLNIVLKARQLFMSTTIDLFLLDTVMFNSHVKAGIIAHTKLDASKIFQDKVLFPYENMEPTVKAALPQPVASSRQELAFNNDSSLYVGVSMRSDTLQYLHVSEFGKICAKYPEKAREIVTGAFNAVQVGQVIFVESTAEGRHGYFFDYCKIAMDNMRLGRYLTPLDWKFFFYPWWLDPTYSLPTGLKGVVISPQLNEYFNRLKLKHGISLTPGQMGWYVKKYGLEGPDMRREYPSYPEEAFEAVIEGAYYASQFAKIREEGRICKVPYRDGILVDTWWDLGIRDKMAIWFTQDVGQQVHVIDFYQNSGEGFGHYRDILNERGYRYGRHSAPHDVMKRQFVGAGVKTTLDVAAEVGIVFETVPRGLVEPGIEMSRQMLSICWFDEEKCEEGITCLENYRKEWDEGKQEYKKKPLENWAIHGADAYRTFATGHQWRTYFGVSSDLPPQEMPDGAWT